MFPIKQQSVVRWFVAGALLCGASGAANADGDRKIPAAYLELMQQSLEQKSGLMFYVKGAAVPGVVTRLGDDGVVEARNQERDRIVIRLDRIDAVAR